MSLFTRRMGADGEEFVDNDVLVFLVGFQDTGRKVGFVWRIWERLRLEAERLPFVVGSRVLRAGQGAIQEVSGLELDAGR
jgi:hypothetical protein